LPQKLDKFEPDDVATSNLLNFLGVAQAVNSAKPVDIAELANSANCKTVLGIVNPNGSEERSRPFFSPWLAKSLSSHGFF
jgi:hypothetical protein